MGVSLSGLDVVLSVVEVDETLSVAKVLVLGVDELEVAVDEDSVVGTDEDNVVVLQ